jgi:hypothetical protein
MTKEINDLVAGLVIVMEESIQKRFDEMEIQKPQEKQFYSLKEMSYITGLSVNAIKGRYRRQTLIVVYEGQTPLIPSDEVKRILFKLERQRDN